MATPLAVNLSADHVALYYQQEHYFLKRANLDSTFGPFVVNLYKKNPYSEVMVLNGP